MTDPAEDVIAAIRELGRVAHATDSPPAALAEALNLVNAAQAALADGEPRRRWYEVDEGHTDATRARNRELSTFSGTLNPVAPPMTIERGELADGRPHYRRNLGCTFVASHSVAAFHHLSLHVSC